VVYQETKDQLLSLAHRLVSWHQLDNKPASYKAVLKLSLSTAQTVITLLEMTWHAAKVWPRNNIASVDQLTMKATNASPKTDNNTQPPSAHQTQFVQPLPRMLPSEQLEQLLQSVFQHAWFDQFDSNKSPESTLMMIILILF
jgi:hypothetical protein